MARGKIMENVHHRFEPSNIHGGGAPPPRERFACFDCPHPPRNDFTPNTKSFRCECVKHTRFIVELRRWLTRSHMHLSPGTSCDHCAQLTLVYEENKRKVGMSTILRSLCDASIACLSRSPYNHFRPKLRKSSKFTFFLPVSSRRQRSNRQEEKEGVSPGGG